MMGNKNDLEIERRFLVRPGFKHYNLPNWLKFRELTISQLYLKKTKKGGNKRVRSVHDVQKNTFTYFLTEKRPTDNPAIRFEDEREITCEEHMAILIKEDNDNDSIMKQRLIFKWSGQIFELDIFLSPMRLVGLVILEIELKRPNQKVKLPDFIPIVAEITGFLSNADLSKRPQ